MKKNKMKDVKRFQGLTWTPKSIPANRIIENKKKKSSSRQSLKAECRKILKNY